MKYNLEINMNNDNYDCLFLYETQLQKINHNFQNKIYQYFLQKKNNLFFKINKFILIKANTFNNKKEIIIFSYNKKIKDFLYFKKTIKTILNIIKAKKYKNILINVKNICKNKSFDLRIKFFIYELEKLNYNFNNFKKNKYKKINKKISFLIQKKNNINKVLHVIKQSTAISQGIKKAKDLSNTPPNICNPKYIYKKIIKTFKHKKVFITAIKENKMKKIGMNAYLCVGKGAKNKSIMSIIKYNRNKKAKPIIIIGKGLTFDSGGISLKPSLSMETMKYDMSGAAVVYGVIYALCKLNINLNVIGVLACAENMPDGNATRPGDIVKTLSGKTVEIINTDAEGRLVLCDTITYIQKYNPKVIIDIATLTGACTVALGKKITGFLSNSKKYVNLLKKASKKSFDNIWQLPLFEDYNKSLLSNVADIKNCANKSAASTIVAACFLKNFINKNKWIHFDIAGTAYDQQGSTGKPIDLLMQFLINYANNKKNA